MSYNCLLCNKDREEVRFSCRCRENHGICNECGAEMQFDEAVEHFPSGHYVVDLLSGTSPFALAASLGKNVWTDWKKKCARAKQLMPTFMDASGRTWLLVARNMLLSKEMEELGVVTKTDVKTKFDADIGAGRRKDIGFVPFHESLCYATNICVSISGGGEEKDSREEKKEYDDLFCLQLCAMDAPVDSWHLRKGQRYNFDCCFKAFPPFNQMSFKLESPSFPFDASYQVEIEITGVQIGVNNAALFITAGKCTDELFANDMSVSFPTNICYSNGVSAKLRPDDDQNAYKQYLERKFRIDSL